jgi:hypothetical protein
VGWRRGYDFRLAVVFDLFGALAGIARVCASAFLISAFAGFARHPPGTVT